LTWIVSKGIDHSEIPMQQSFSRQSTTPNDGPALIAGLDKGLKTHVLKFIVCNTFVTKKKVTREVFHNPQVSIQIETHTKFAKDAT